MHENNRVINLKYVYIVSLPPRLTPRFCKTKSLHNNFMTGEGAKALAEALMHKNNKLLHLELVHFAFTFFTRINSQQRQSLADNIINMEGIYALAQTLLRAHCKVENS